MSHSDRPIEHFLAVVRQRLNRHRLWNTLIWAMVAAAGTLVVLGLWYTLRGYAVPPGAILSTLALATAGAAIAFAFRLLNTEAAARSADRLFRLHDSITSYLHFSQRGNRDGYYALQAEQTEKRVAPLDPQEIKYQAPQRGLVLAACLLAIAVPLGLRGPSAEVVREQELEKQTLEATTVINEQLEKQVEELEKEAAKDDEKELLDPNKLRQWVKELEETGDHKEALRQYTQLERKLNEARLAVQNKRDEQLLERAARELENSRETQPLAKDLEQKNYDKAAEQMEKMQPKGDKSLEKQRQDLARLKAAAQHMAAAARASKAAASSAAKSEAKANSSQSKSSEANGKPSGNKSGGSGGAGSDGGGSEMAEAMEQLSQAVSDLDKVLSEAQHQEKQQGKCDAEKKGECQACQKCVGECLSKLNNQMKKLAMCQRTGKKLSSLCQSCSQCQGNLASLCQISKPGGKKAGWGSSDERRSETDELVDNGQNTQLQGIKGQGPSVTSVEAAEEGSGVSTRKSSTKQRNFQRQYESFVSREDIPEQVKDGVKHYFEVIHNVTPAVSSESSSPGSSSEETSTNGTNGS